ncbi:Ribonuclease P protein subunit p40 [Mycena venus]|uniref:Ribonuclease P protein subunit p40 n=1 Tax=Mycena venus TaxID=2733690 RepID=A0A8H7D1Z2_9AGAR|nr:Ribonuclease P protein subunit p40 [Mycena venus]
MDIPDPPRQRVHISTGDLPSKKIQTLAAAHPFTQQERSSVLDIVFPANDALEMALCKLETAYVKASMELASLVEQAETFVSPLEMKSNVTALSVTPHSDNIWCLDQRGVLTLHLSAESYQTLGITGQKLPFKSRSSEHTVTLPLQPSADSLKNRQKRDAALKAWDMRRSQAGEAPWTVLYCANDAEATTQFAASNGHANLMRMVKCQTTASHSVRVPTVNLPARPPTSDLDAVEDWDEEMHALFEWVGMAGLGSQRLQANDRADAYVAVYEPPQSSTATVGDVTRLQWRGFLSPDFVQSVMDVVLSVESPHPQFVSITSHAFPAAPVSYIPPGKDKDRNLRTPARVPSEDGEDTWSLLVAREGDTKRWCLAESIGPLDTRWG